MLTAGRPNDRLSERIRARARGLSPSLARVLDFIDTHRQEAMTKSALELAAVIGTSDATVIRAVQAAGFGGLRELRQMIAASFGAGQTPLDTINRTFASIKQRSVTAVDQVFSDHQEAFAALASEETRASIFAAVRQLAPARRIGVFGISSTAFLARYFALSLNRIGRSTMLIDGYTAPIPEQLLEMRNVDALLMLAYGKPFREAASTVAEARRRKVPIVLVTDTKEKAITRHASVIVPVLRGHAGRIAMHGATLVCLEAIGFALTAEDPQRAISAIERLSELRRATYK
jgi:DNA-binding MurR/RpiR family transcriptional regulator